MHSPPSDPRHRDRPHARRPTWRGILVSYALAAAIPLSLWAMSRPLPGAVAVAAAGGLFVAARRARRLVRCFQDCRGFAVDLFGSVRITVARVPVDEN